MNTRQIRGKPSLSSLRPSMSIALAITLLSLMMPTSIVPAGAGGGKPGGGGGGGGGGGSKTGADLSITLTDSPDPIEVGGDLTYKTSAKNSGPQTATGVTVTDELPATVEFVSASSTKGSCTGSTTVTCNLGDLAKRATATVTIIVRASQAGTISNTATVSATQTDPNSANNSATASTTVTGSPSPSPTPTLSPSPTSSPTPTTSPSPTASPTPTTSPSPTTSPTPPSGSGELDQTFGTDGKVTTDFDGEIDHGQAVAIQPDGNIVVGGCSPRFSEAEDCRIVTGTQKHAFFYLARYTPAGTLDETFGDGGKVRTVFERPARGEFALGVTDMAIRPDGKIVAVASLYQCPGLVYAPPTIDRCPGLWLFGIAMARYNSDGSIDRSFGTGGTIVWDPAPLRFSFDVGAMALQNDGKIVVVGRVCCGIEFFVARFLENGVPDPTFGSGGFVTTKFSNPCYWAQADAVVVQDDGKIVVGGFALDYVDCRYVDSDFALARYLPTGALDPTFGSDGLVVTDVGSWDQVTDLALSGSGGEAKILAVGDAGSDAALARYNLADGSLDTTFGGSGTGFTTTNLGGVEDIFGVALDASGGIVVAGASDADFVLARYGPHGVLDSSFGSNGKVLTDFGGIDKASDVAIQPADGKIVAVGRGARDFALARYLP